MTEEHTEPRTSRRVMVAMAHPDDAEFGCAGTMARWASEGDEIILVLGTSGDKGSDDPNMTGEQLVATREAEQKVAADTLGVSEIVFMRMRDAELVPDLAMRRDLTRIIRQVRPDVVFCQDPTARWEGSEYIQHPDHLAMGEATLAAVFPSARDRLTFPELLAEGLEPHKVGEVYIGSSLAKCDTFIDIGAHLETKLNALAAHKSQMGDWDFRSALTGWARDAAAFARFKSFPGADAMEYAEAFKYLKVD
ncbi:MAG: PIG-L family deacetylase [Thermomicrobiales bacterium]|nr:PIG-L family deacetylase [Thermomicrobiales bacterium]